jgi:hypothetical protein
MAQRLTPTYEQSNEERLAAALRENLKKRKAQLRGRREDVADADAAAQGTVAGKAGEQSGPDSGKA